MGHVYLYCADHSKSESWSRYSPQNISKFVIPIAVLMHVYTLSLLGHRILDWTRQSSVTWLVNVPAHSFTWLRSAVRWIWIKGLTCEGHHKDCIEGKLCFVDHSSVQLRTVWTFCWVCAGLVTTKPSLTWRRIFMLLHFSRTFQVDERSYVCTILTVWYLYANICRC